MARYIIQYGLPLLVILPLVLWGVRVWYLRVFPRTVENVVEIDRASKKYDRKLKKG